MEEVWERFYNEVLEEIGTRAYPDDLLDFEARDHDNVFDHEARDYDEDIFERSPMKKFGTDLLTGVLQKTPSWHKQNEAKKEREKPRSPRMAQVYVTCFSTIVIHDAESAVRVVHSRPRLRPKEGLALPRTLVFHPRRGSRNNPQPDRS